GDWWLQLSVWINDLELRQAFSGYPQTRGAVGQHGRTPFGIQLRKKLLPSRTFGFGQKTELDQGIVKLVCIARLGPRFFTHPIDRGLVKLAHVTGGLRIEPAARKHGARASFFERCIVEVCVRACVENFLRKRRRLDDVARKKVLLVTLD